MTNLSYPIMIFHDGVVNLMRSSAELCRFSRWGFAESRQVARRGRCWLLDAEGRYFKIVDWEKNSSAARDWLTFFYFWAIVAAAPVLSEARHLPLPDFKKKILRALNARFRFDVGVPNGDERAEVIERTNTYVAALEAVADILNYG